MKHASCRSGRATDSKPCIIRTQDLYLKNLVLHVLSAELLRKHRETQQTVHILYKQHIEAIIAAKTNMHLFGKLRMHVEGMNVILLHGFPERLIGVTNLILRFLKAVMSRGNNMVFVPLHIDDIRLR